MKYKINDCNNKVNCVKFNYTTLTKNVIKTFSFIFEA